MGDTKTIGVAYRDQDLIGSTLTNCTIVGPATTGPATVTVSAPTSAVNVNTTSFTSGSATPGTQRAIVGDVTTFTSMTSGNLVGVRGVVTAGGTISAPTSLYGTQGKLITGAHTVNGTMAAVFAQFDMTGGTIGTGNQSAIAANFVGVAAGNVALDGVYVENAGGGAIHSYLRGYGNSVYALDFTGAGYCTSTTGTPGAVTGGTGWIKVFIDGAIRYIPLATTGS